MPHPTICDGVGTDRSRTDHVPSPGTTHRAAPQPRAPAGWRSTAWRGRGRGARRVVLLGLADYLIRFQDRGLRVICSLALLGVAGLDRLPLACPAAVGCGWATSIWPCGFRSGFPTLDDRLASAVEFLRAADDDPPAGSAALRRGRDRPGRRRGGRSISPACWTAGPPRRRYCSAWRPALVAGILWPPRPGRPRGSPWPGCSIRWATSPGRRPRTWPCGTASSAWPAAGRSRSR